MRINLDHQAGSPILPPVLEAMLPFFRDKHGNPSSLHSDGIVAREAIANARSAVANFLNARSADDILFTSNGTEAINLAIKGSALANQGRGRHIVLTTTEHPAVTGSVKFLASLGFTFSKVPVDPEGRVEPEAVRAAVQEDTILICVHHANHDFGTIAPIPAIAEMAASRRIPLFVDAVATAGWVPIDVQALGATFLAISPHRFGGPKGVGVMYRRGASPLVPLIHGGAQEGGSRAGTENVPSIVGAGVAVEITQHDLIGTAERLRALQQAIVSGVLGSLRFVRLNGPAPGPDRLPNNLNFSISHIEGEALALLMDLRGVAIGSGSACVTKEQKIPPALQAIGLDETAARGTIILTLGRDTDSRQVTTFLQLLPKSVAHLREMSPEWSDFEQTQTN